MLGDIPLSRMVTVFARNNRHVAEVIQLRGETVQNIQAHQVIVIADAIHQVSWLITAIGFQILQLCQHWRQAGAACQHQYRPFNGTQVEAAHGAGQGHLVTGAGLAH